jgi:hypothetical protein
MLGRNPASARRIDGALPRWPVGSWYLLEFQLLA